MNNFFEIKFENRTYKGENSIHPVFVNSLLRLLRDGFVDPFEYSMTNLFSINNKFASNYVITDTADFIDENHVGIYSFKEYKSALDFYQNNIYTNDINIEPISPFDSLSSNSYSASSVSDFSIYISQRFYYSPTSNDFNVSIRSKSFSLKSAWLQIHPSILMFYHPLFYIDVREKMKVDYIDIFPGENFQIRWNLDFNSIVSSNINNISGRIHDHFKKSLKEVIISNSSISAQNIDNTFSYQIGGIVAYRDANGALLNSGSTSNDSAIFLSGATSCDINAINSTITYSLDYKNNTGKQIQIASLLLSGSLSSDVKSLMPISYIYSKDLWGDDVKIVNPNERIKFNWSLNLNPPKRIQDIKNIDAE